MISEKKRQINRKSYYKNREKNKSRNKFIRFRRALKLMDDEYTRLSQNRNIDLSTLFAAKKIIDVIQKEAVRRGIDLTDL